MRQILRWLWWEPMWGRLAFMILKRVKMSGTVSITNCRRLLLFVKLISPSWLQPHRREKSICMESHLPITNSKNFSLSLIKTVKNKSQRFLESQIVVMIKKMTFFLWLMIKCTSLAMICQEFVLIRPKKNKSSKRQNYFWNRMKK